MPMEVREETKRVEHGRGFSGIYRVLQKTVIGYERPIPRSDKLRRRGIDGAPLAMGQPWHTKPTINPPPSENPPSVLGQIALLKVRNT